MNKIKLGHLILIGLLIQPLSGNATNAPISQVDAEKIMLTATLGGDDGQKLNQQLHQYQVELNSGKGDIKALAGRHLDWQELGKDAVGVMAAVPVSNPRLAGTIKIAAASYGAGLKLYNYYDFEVRTIESRAKYGKDFYQTLFQIEQAHPCEAKKVLTALSSRYKTDLVNKQYPPAVEEYYRIKDIEQNVAGSKTLVSAVVKLQG